MLPKNQHLSPAEVHGQLDRVMEQLLEPFAHVAELLAGGVLAKQHDEWAAARSKGKSGGTEFVQPLLRELIIAQLKIVLFGGSAAQLIVGCESRKRVLRSVLKPG